jgi:CHAT domain-containing protein/tetratricopeptide (TPR) repeat protein
MVLPVLTLLVFAQTAAATDPTQIQRAVQRAQEERTIDRLDRTWRATARRDPRDRQALLWAATIARYRYQYERADTLYRQVIALGPAKADVYTAAAHLGMALWRALGFDVARADTLYTLAHAEAADVRSSRMAFEATTGLSQIRGRTAGPRVGIQLVRQAWSELVAPTAEDTAQHECSEGALLEQLGDSTGARRIGDGARIAQRAHAWKAQGSCNLLYAQSGERRGYLDAAKGYANVALEAFDSANFLPGTALASQWFGYVMVARGELSEGRMQLERAVRAAQETRFESVEAWAHSGLAEVFVGVGDLRVAREHAARAARLHAAHGDLWGLANSLSFEASILEAQHQLTASADKYAETVAAFRRAGLPLNAVVPLRQLALVEMRLGNLDSAEHTLEQTTAIARASASPGWMNELRLHLSRLAMLRGNLTLADSLLRTVPASLQWRGHDASRIEYVKTAVYEAQLAVRTGRSAVAESAVTFVSSMITKWRQESADRELRAGAAQRRTGWESLSLAYPDLVAGLAAERRLDVAFHLIESVRARELTEASLRAMARLPDSSKAARTFRGLDPSRAVAGIDDLRSRLGRDEAFVSLTLGIDRGPSTAVVVTADSAFAVSLPGEDELGPLIERYTRVAAAGTEPVQVGRQLGRALLVPIARALPTRITKLLVSPDGELFHLPFDAMRLADDRFAVERFAISLMPSATYAVVERSTPHTIGGSRIVALANPAFRYIGRPMLPGGAPLLRGGNSDFAAITLSPLPHSNEEARRVAQYGVQSRVYSQQEASETFVRTSDWHGVGVVHFATHALVDREGPSRTALALAPSASDDGFLTPIELTSVRFEGALVVLSACETLGGQILGGEGLRGLAGPLLESGARAVVATQWSIGDRSVVPFIDRFYAAMAGGDNVGDALRHAKLAAIRDGARISDWAAFTVIGDASMRPVLRVPRLSPLQWLRDLVQPMRDTTGT